MTPARTAAPPSRRHGVRLRPAAARRRRAAGETARCAAAPQAAKLGSVIPIATEAIRGGNVWRGIYGVSDMDISLLSKLPVGTAYGWGTPASATLDEDVARRFARVPPKTGGALKIGVELDEGSQASRPEQINSVIFHITGVTVGIPLWPLSQYPEELELLVPPFTSFLVTKIGPIETHNTVKVLNMHLSCERWCKQQIDGYDEWVDRVRDTHR
eukprot:gene9108-20851_t